MTVQNELVAAIEAEPDDESNPLVLADLLQSNGDERGELIVLDHHERATPGGLADPEAMDRLLLLAAYFGFPHARDLRYAPLPFARQREFWKTSTLTCIAHHGDHRYELVYRSHTLMFRTDNPVIVHQPHYGIGIELTTADGGDWTDDEMAVIVEIVSDAIQAGTPVPELSFPFTAWPLPFYPGAPRRVYEIPREYRDARGLARQSCGLAARDYRRWHAIRNRLRSR